MSGYLKATRLIVIKPLPGDPNQEPTSDVTFFERFSVDSVQNPSRNGQSAQEDFREMIVNNG